MQTPPGQDLPTQSVSTQRLFEQTWSAPQVRLGQLGGRQRPCRQVSPAAQGVAGQLVGSTQTFPSPQTWVPVQSAVLLQLTGWVPPGQVQPANTKLASASATTWKFRMAADSILLARGHGSVDRPRRAG